MVIDIWFRMRILAHQQYDGPPLPKSRNKELARRWFGQFLLSFGHWLSSWRSAPWSSRQYVVVVAVSPRRHRQSARLTSDWTDRRACPQACSGSVPQQSTAAFYIPKWCRVSLGVLRTLEPVASVATLQRTRLPARTPSVRCSRARIRWPDSRVFGRCLSQAPPVRPASGPDSNCPNAARCSRLRRSGSFRQFEGHTE